MQEANKTDIEEELLKRGLARANLKEFIKHNYTNYISGKHLDLLCEKLQQVELFIRTGGEDGIGRLMINMPPRHGKEMANTSQIFTTEGWKNHGDLRVGDYVFHPSGRPVKVTHVFPVNTSDEYRVEVTMSDGSRHICHPNHEWTVYDRTVSRFITVETNYWLKDTRLGRPRKLTSGQIGKRGGRYLYQLQNIGALEMEERELPIEPYALGAWLGDGTSTSAEITYAEKDREAIDRVSESWGDPSSINTHKTTGCHRAYFSGVIKDLRGANVLDNKHIPEVYKLSSIGQRLQLIAGLIDTDGHVCRKTERVRIVTVSKGLAEDIKEVATSLGFRPYISFQDPALSSSGIQGKRRVYTVGFQPTMQIPTVVPRKRIVGREMKRRISITNVKIVPSQPGRCITVDSTDGLYLVGRSLIPTHNSMHVSEHFPAWFLGRNPDKRVILTSYGADLSEGWSLKIRQLMEGEKYQATFGKNSAWDEQVDIDPDARKLQAWEIKNNIGGLVAVGVRGATTGRGAHLLLLDDVLKDREEADSETIKKRVWEWYTGVARTRLMKGGAIVVVATRWCEDDLPGTLLETQGEKWEHINFPAIAEEEDDLGRQEGQPLWPEMFDLQTLMEIKEDIGPRDWGALYQQRPTSADGEVFKSDWFTFGKTPQRDDISRCYQVWDTALTERSDGDFSVGANVLVTRDGLFISDIIRGRFSFPELKRKMIQFHTIWNDVYRVSRIYIENKGSGQSAVQSLKRDTNLPVIPINVEKDFGKSKVQRANAAAGYIESGRVYFKENAPWVDDMIKEMTSFPRGKHDDIVDTIVYCCLMSQGGGKAPRRMMNMKGLKPQNRNQRVMGMQWGL